MDFIIFFHYVWSNANGILQFMLCMCDTFVLSFVVRLGMNMHVVY